MFFSPDPLQEGIFHSNTFLTVDLASPHLLQGSPSSQHRIVVMRDLEDGQRSFAIDEFPVMEPDSIEEFWMRKVDAARLKRELEFRKLEYEYARWEQQQQMGSGVPPNGGEAACVGACEEREQAGDGFRWLTDDEFLELERKTRRLTVQDAAAVAADGSVEVGGG